MQTVESTESLLAAIVATVATPNDGCRAHTAALMSMWRSTHLMQTQKPLLGRTVRAPSGLRKCCFLSASWDMMVEYMPSGPRAPPWQALLTRSSELPSPTLSGVLSFIATFPFFIEWPTQHSRPFVVSELSPASTPSLSCSSLSIFPSFFPFILSNFVATATWGVVSSFNVKEVETGQVGFMVVWNMKNTTSNPL